MGDEINVITNKLEDQGIKVHIWEKKELENYAIDFRALYRAFTTKFSTKYGNTNVPISRTEFQSKLLSIADGFKQDVVAQLISSRHKSNPSIDISTISKQTISECDTNWENIEYRMNVILGKEFFAKLNSWLSNEYHIAIPIGFAIDNLQVDEIDSEVRDVIGEFVAFVFS